MTVFPNVGKLLLIIICLAAVALILRLVLKAETNIQWKDYLEKYNRVQYDFKKNGSTVILYAATKYNGTEMSDQLLVDENCTSEMAYCEISTNSALLHSASAILVDESEYSETNPRILKLRNNSNNIPWITVGCSNSSGLQTFQSFCQLCKHFHYLPKNSTENDNLLCLNRETML